MAAAPKTLNLQFGMAKTRKTRNYRLSQYILYLNVNLLVQEPIEFFFVPGISASCAIAQFGSFSR
jgi:hypothetical protein